MAGTVLNFDRSFKNIDRAHRAAGLSPRRSALILPSTEGLDVAELTRAGALTEGTRQWWIERDRNLIPHLQRKRADYIYGDNVEIVHSALEDFVPPEPLDYVNADMMSLFSSQLAYWMVEDVRPKLLDGATVVVNFVAKVRRTEFYDWFLAGIRETHPAHVEAFEFASSTYTAPFLAPRLLMCCALYDRTFDWLPMYRYADTRTNMGSLRIDNIQPANRIIWPRFDELSVPSEYGGRAARGADRAARGVRNERGCILRSTRGHTGTTRPRMGRDASSLTLADLRALQSCFSAENPGMIIQPDLEDGSWRIVARRTGKLVCSFTSLDELEATFF